MVDIPSTVHRQLLDIQREYLFVGGMPESVSHFIQSGEFSEAAKFQQSIIETYKDDFSKHNQTDQLIRLHWVFNYVPSAVGTKTKYCHISREDKARELKNAISTLTKAGVISPIYHSSCSGIPLHAQADDHKYKLLFLDIGLMNRICGLDWLAVRFDLNLPSFQTVSHKNLLDSHTHEVKVNLLSLPLYLIGQLYRLIDTYRETGLG